VDGFLGIRHGRRVVGLMTSALDGLDTRHKAAAILGGAKLRMLEDAGLAVVDKQRLETLEQLYKAVKVFKGTELLSQKAVDVIEELEAMERE
jgi:hypothetical protein